MTAPALRLVEPPPPEPDRAAVADTLAGLWRQVGQALDVLAGIPGPLRLERLRASLGEACSDALDAAHAAEILANGAPLADRFPDGSPRPEALTPRQVLYLADLAIDAPERARQAAEAAERTARRNAAIAQHNAAHGFHGPRRCASKTKAGWFCRASSLNFTERPVCRGHATEDERRANAAASDAYRATFPVFPEEA